MLKHIFLKIYRMRFCLMKNILNLKKPKKKNEKVEKET